MPLHPLSIPSFLVLLTASSLAVFGAAEVWVDPVSGEDLAAGTKEKPVASVDAGLRRAREIRRAEPAKAQGGISVMLAKGTHWLREPVLVRAADSGTAESPLIIAAETPGQAALLGGKLLDTWRPAGVADSRVPATVRAQVLVAECLDEGGSPLTVRQLWVGAEKAERARFPDAPQMARLSTWKADTQLAGSRLEGLPALADLRGAELFVMQQWEIAHLRLASLRRDKDETFFTFRQPESRVEFEHPWPQPIMPPDGAGAFMVVGAPELISRPGEWAQDAASGRIYLWPAKPVSPKELRAVVPVAERVLRVLGSVDAPVRHVSVRGLVFGHTAWTRPSTHGHVPLQAGMYLEDGYRITPPGSPDNPTLDNQDWIGRPAAAVTVEGAEELAFDSCAFTHTAMSGLDLVRAARRIAVRRCLFEDIGGNAIQAGSFQDGEGVETHIPYNPTDERVLVRDCVIEDNTVRDAANEDWGCVGIIAGYVRDFRIQHNEISEVSYTAISLGWGWTRTVNCMRNNLVRANRLHHIATRMCDTAGVYTLSAQPGTVVCENVVSDIRMSPYVDRPDHWFYLYTDEGSSYITVRDNWTEAPKYLQNANGPNNVWENNGPHVSAEIKARAGVRGK